jgi:hypothetical protein
MNHDWEKSQANILQNTLDLVNQKPPALTNQQLLRILGQRIARGEISKTYCKGFPYLGAWEEKSGQLIIQVCLATGRITEKEGKNA